MIMKSSSVFLILGILIISVGLAWIISGGISAPAAEKVPLTPAPTVVVVNPTTTMAVPVTTAPLTTPATGVLPAPTTKSTTTSTVISGEDVRNHFLDIAYTSTNRLERLDYSSDRPRVVISATSASDDEIAVIEKTIKTFNEASQTVELSENVKETDSGDILIRFLPEDGLKAINLNSAAESGPFSDVLTRRELYQGDVIGAKVLRGTIYINGNLKGDAKKHMLVRSLMYQMGLTGETTKYPDSIFYAGENTNIDLALVDKRAITMLYEPGFANGMNADDLRERLYIP